jgi:hypothetical protein
VRTSSAAIPRAKAPDELTGDDVGASWLTCSARCAQSSESRGVRPSRPRK